MKEFIFTWKLENICYSWHKAQESILSPEFIAAPIENSIRRLQLYPRGNSMLDYIALFLHRDEDNGAEDLSFNLELSCISAENSPLHTCKFFENDIVFRKLTGFGHPRFMTRREVFFRRKDLYLPRDTLTLRCRLWKNEGIINEYGESFGLTRLDISRIESVENINSRISDETTARISSKCVTETLISISLLQCEDSMKVQIQPISVENLKFSILKLFVVEKMNKQILHEHMCVWLDSPKPEVWRFPSLHKLLKNQNNDDIENDVQLMCEFVYSTGEETEHLEYHNPYLSVSPEIVSKYIYRCIPSGNLSDCPGISQNMWNLYVEHDLCDIEFKTPTTSFFAHGIVLWARSPVFLAMLTGDTEERKSKCIKIEDIVDPILEKFLRFLYTDSFEDLEWLTVIGLYYAADKYQVERLKLLCCSYFLENANFDNVCELLLLADRHHDSYFKKKLEDFILHNDEKIFSSTVGKKFVDEQSHLSAKTMLLKYDRERGKENAKDTYEEKLSKHPKALDGFKSAYQSKILSDITIKTKDSTFYVHKSILCASSSTLRETLNKDLRDKSGDILEMEDLEDDILSQLLLFLYSDSLENLEWDIVVRLYREAIVYKIQRLQIVCSCFLLEKLGVCNASDVLLLAHEHNDVKLKSVVEDFIFLHDEEIFGSDERAEFSKTNLLLANETMCLKYRKRSKFS